jgi:hypothetical protein
LLPIAAWRGDWSGDVLQGVPDAVLHDGFETRGDAAFPLGCAKGLGDLGGEASELEEVGWLGDSSS